MKLSKELNSADLKHDVNRPLVRIFGNLLQIVPEFGQELMYDESFQTFILSVLLPSDTVLFKKDCLWVLSNILGGPSEHPFEFLIDNKTLLNCLVQLGQHPEYAIKKEALICMYNLCENHGNKYL